MKNLAAVAAGGAAGTYLRFVIGQSMWIGTYPLGTLVVNIAGSFLLGILTGSLLMKPGRTWLKAGLGAGFCGGFTTMSTFASDTVLLAAGEASLFLIYTAGSIFGGLAAALLGFLFSTLLTKKKGAV
ncbi:fluoride efflux transporter FluC [Alkalicoccus halolimnae]|uniref:Fluoride-specific ion channel FluC n=1 Tax=Alkalicoccus halolimnae TaxID=1667239 RepID=A0A5C7F1V2_9BACI|nr:CrcB family protein [Alkalicoccus halolimnae]TXF82338.1 CrcB family protein [Alkalicoccus halolimnae]